jgi:hypothetical protein
MLELPSKSFNSRLESGKYLTGWVRVAKLPVVTMGCGDACPLFPEEMYEDWDVEDPAGGTLEEVRAIRHQIGLRVLDLMAELEIAPDLSGPTNWAPRRAVAS